MFAASPIAQTSGSAWPSFVMTLRFWSVKRLETITCVSFASRLINMAADLCVLSCFSRESIDWIRGLGANPVLQTRRPNGTTAAVVSKGLD